MLLVTTPVLLFSLSIWPFSELSVQPLILAINRILFGIYIGTYMPMAVVISPS